MAKAPKAVEEEKDDLFVSMFTEVKALPRIVVKELPTKKAKKSPTEKGNGMMEGSWFVTPPPCFTKPNTFSLPASPEEDSLIEHPSISGSVNSIFNCDNISSSNASTPLISSPQGSPMSISTSSTPTHSPPVSPINRRAKITKVDVPMTKVTNEKVPTPEKEIVQADIRALARRTLTLRSRTNRFAELEKQAEDPDTTDHGMSVVSQPLVIEPTTDPRQQTIAETMAESSDVFYGPENKSEDNDDDTDSIDTTESLVSDDENENDAEYYSLTRPIMAENLSSLNIVSRMDRKGRGRSKKVNKGKKSSKNEKENGNENEDEVVKRSSSSERAHAGE